MIPLQSLNRVVAEAWARNPFYRHKWTDAGLRRRRLAALADLAAYPFTTRAEFVADQKTTPPLGANRSCPLAAFRRIHCSSGTTRAPVFWADTARTWPWVLRGSATLFRLAGIRRTDRLLFAMPFGPSSGPWILYEGAQRLGALSFTCASAEPETQRAWLDRFRPSVVVGRPAQLLALAAAEPGAGRRGPSLAVPRLVLTGQPSSASFRARLRQAWGAECFDRYGMTEAGSVAGECPSHPGGLHLLDEAFVAESIDPATGQPAGEGEPGELVLTTLGRVDRPIIRYRTGDRVRLIRNHRCRCGRTGTLLAGGVRRLGAGDHEP